LIELSSSRTPSFVILKKSGELALESQGRIHGFFGSLDHVEVGGKIGFLSEDGTWLLAPKFDDVEPRYDNGDCGLIDCRYRFVSENGKWFGLDDAGQYINKVGFDELPAEQSEGLRAVKTNGLWGYLNKDWEFVIQPRYLEAGPFIGGIALVTFGQQRGYIKANGDLLTFDALEYSAQTGSERESGAEGSCAGLLKVTVNIVNLSAEQIKLSITKAPDDVRVKGSKNFFFAYGACSATSYSLLASAAGDARSTPHKFDLDIPSGSDVCEVELYPTGGTPTVHCTR
jgi:hypothetical protein